MMRRIRQQHTRERASAPRLHRLVAAAAALPLLLAPVLGLAAPAAAAPGDQASARARLLSGSALLDGVDLDAVVALQGEAASRSGEAATQVSVGSLDVSALGALSVTAPDGVSVPLGDLLALGVGNQYAEASEFGVSRAAVGAVSDAGVVDTSGGSGYPSDASLSLDALLGGTAASELLSVELDLGALAATADLDAGAATSDRDYVIAGGTLTLQSASVGTVDDLLTGTGGVADDVDAAIGTLVGDDGLLAQALAGLNPALALLPGSSGIDISISSDVTGALDAVLDAGLSDTAITIDLRSGEITVDLDTLLQEETGHGLNDLDPGQSILDGAVLSALVTRIGTLLDTLPGAVDTALTGALEIATLHVEVDVCLVPGVLPGTCSTGITVSVPDETLADVLDGSADATVALTVLGVPIVVPLGTLLGALSTPITSTLFAADTGAIDVAVDGLVTDLAGIASALGDAVTALSGVVAIVGNVQEDGTAGAGSLREVAVRVSLGDILGAGGILTVDLARAEVGVNVAGAYAPVLDAESPVVAGSTSLLTSSGWPADAAVTVRIYDGVTPVGSPLPVTVDGTGAFPGGTVIDAPAVPGSYTVIAVDTDGNEAEDELIVTASSIPVLQVTGPVEPGDEAPITSSGWPADTDVEVTLLDGVDVIAGPITVHTDGDGAFPPGTTITVPLGTPAGDYTVEGDDGDQTADDTLTVIVYTPVLDASSPVEAGSASALLSSGWPPNVDVEVQLRDGGAAIGAPVMITTDGSGEFPAGSVLPIGAGTVPGPYTATAVDADGHEASDDITVVVASSPVATIHVEVIPRGELQGITGAGFLPGESVSSDVPGGIGPLAPQTADGSGIVEFSWFVPADDALGGYTVTLTGETSGSAADDFTVIDAGVGGDGGDSGGGGGDGRLADTGINGLAPAALAVLAIAAGAGLALSRARRRDEVDGDR